MVDPLIRYAYFGFADAPSIVVRYAIAYELLRPVYELRGVLENVYKRNRVFKADVFVTDLGYGAPLSKALAKSTGQTSEESSYVLDPLYSLCYCDPSVEERFKALQKKSK
ncbi:uncharacterized protein BYT42DRAFT_610198 [Radiomyces spectabilis]|uniref:uncharacterized protein n=1 Tax=Radiomyces spectabilis TaxID=64574 RepID=UPI00221E4DB7|nr:uncharacterized protein BYT42DRAFT_610198 [Radiomyces spectabilis]KAI8390927.1 hypothetical protein BYT42DRAFT_610198 [Radiomyces spectabilis]